MHIFFAYTTNTYAFKSVVFLRHWGTEIFLHDKKCTSVLSRLFKETRPIKWKSTVHQFINENGKLHKKNIRFEQKKIYCRSTYFCQLLKSPVRTEAGGTQKQVLAPGTLGWRTLTVLPQAVACSGEAWFFACCLHFHLASASVCWFPLLCHIPHAISVWMSIFSRATLQSQFTAVINGFAIPLASFLPLSGKLK